MIKALQQMCFAEFQRSVAVETNSSPIDTLILEGSRDISLSVVCKSLQVLHCMLVSLAKLQHPPGDWSVTDEMLCLALDRITSPT